MESYVKQHRKETNKGIEFSINEHLSVLNSDLVLPQKNDRVNYTKLIATVKSRETVYNNLLLLINDKHINPEIKKNSQKKILSGLKKTREQLLEKIMNIPMRNELDNTEENDGETSDDIITNISNTHTIASKTIYDIEERILFYENPDEVKQKKLDEQTIPSFPERYVKN